MLSAFLAMLVTAVNCSAIDQQGVAGWESDHRFPKASRIWKGPMFADRTGVPNTLVLYGTDSSIEEVCEHYDSVFEREGFKIVSRRSTQRGDLIDSVLAEGPDGLCVWVDDVDLASEDEWMDGYLEQEDVLDKLDDYPLIFQVYVRESCP